MPHAVGGTAILLFLLLNMANTEETTLVLKPEGGLVEIGYCFAADYMVVFRTSSTDGDRLQVNTSADNMATSWGPPDLWGRANITNHHPLLGLLIGHLKPGDSGLYRTECWQNGTLASHSRQQLVVCGEEMESEEVTVLEEGGADVRCGGGGGDGARPGAGATVRWYYKKHQSDKTVLFLDSSVSLDPLLPDLRGAVDVRDGGALLHMSDGVLQDSRQFYCAVMDGQNCLRFQNINLPESAEAIKYASQGDRVALKCSSAHQRQSWVTPLGRINTTTKSPASREGSAQAGQMFISGDNTSIGHSLVIPVVSNKHNGSYSCFSPSLVVQYFLVLCPEVEPREQSAVEGGDISLECHVPHKASVGVANHVQWHRERGAGEERPTPDSEESGWEEIVSEDGSSLKLSGLTADDAGLYWCVTLLEFDDEEYYSSGNDSSDYSDDDYDDVPDLYGDCIGKQEILLTVELNSGDDRGVDLPAPHTALGAAVAGVLLVGVIVAAVVIMKKRSKGCFKQRGTVTDTGPQSHRDAGDMAGDPGCTEMLAPHEASGAC